MTMTTAMENETRNIFLLQHSEEGSTNPVSVLNQFYQKNGVSPATKDCYIYYFDCPSQDGHKWWRCVLTCSLSGKKYHSGLPLDILEEASTGGHTNSCLENRTSHQIRSFFGFLSKDFVLTDDYVNFRTKKMAQKTAVISALEGLSIGTSRTHVRTMYHSLKTEIIPKKIILSKEIDDNNIIEAARTESLLQSRHYPEWVRTLYNLGIESSSISVEFKESHTTLYSKEIFSRSCKTLLCCVLKILQRNLEVSVISKPFQSKNDAIKNAVFLVRDELKNRNDVSILNQHVRNHLLKFKDREFTEKEKIFKYLKNTARSTYVFHLPPFMTDQLRIPCDKVCFKYYLYELVFKSETGKSLGRLGIIFAKDFFDVDIQSREIPLQIKFPLETDESCVGLCYLTNRTELIFNSENASDLQTALNFNIRLDEIKRYGLKPQQKWKYEKTEADSISSLGLNAGRTYVIVPLKIRTADIIRKIASTSNVLTPPTIDWDTMRNVVYAQNTPYLCPRDEGWWNFPFIGKLSSVEVSLLSGLIFVAVFAPYISVFIKKKSLPKLSTVEVIISSVSLCISVFAWVLWKLPPQFLFSEKNFHNKFLLQSRNIYKFANENKKQSLSAYSTFPQDYCDEYKTFKDYYQNRHGILIRWPLLKLVPVYTLSNISDDSFDVRPISAKKEKDQVPSYCENVVHLVPELIHVFPLTRDFMLLYRLYRKVILRLERVIELHRISKKLKLLQRKSSYVITTIPLCNRLNNPTNTTLWQRALGSKTFESQVECATSLFPFVGYERLEHLGDTVLGYFVAINLFSRNANLQWGCNELGNHKSFAVRNQSLFNAALRVGMKSIIWKGGKKWTSAYKCNKIQIEQSASVTNTLDYSGDAFSTELSDGQLSDVLESLLAVAFLYCGKNNKETEESGTMVISILNELCLPIPGLQDKWFTGIPCLLQGYFDTYLNLDNETAQCLKDWQIQLNTIRDILCDEDNVRQKLEFGRIGFLELLRRKEISCQMIEELRSNKFKMLFLCAFFDDSLQSQNNEKECMDNSFELKGIERVAWFRDSLFFVGDSALHLCICSQLYANFSNASPGDLHLLRAVVMSDDSLAYVVLKNGIHDFLFDNLCAVSLLKDILIADSKGGKRWEKNDGWILKGGVSEYRRRCHFFFSDFLSDTYIKSLKPYYVGLAGGCFYGQNGKMNKEVIGDLAFSFKCVVGSLVLSIGLDKMWKCILPFLAELMVLSAEETRREYNGISNICNSYAKGRSTVSLEKIQAKHGIGWSASLICDKTTI